MAESLESATPVQTAPEEETAFVGIVTRAISWTLDAVIINFAAILVGIGAALVLSLFPISKDLKPALEAVAGVAYVVWAALYFVVFWSMTGQTPGARVMQIQLVTAKQGRVKPARAVVRWVGMNLAMLPLFAGYIPIMFRRRGFPDWFAKTLVIESQRMSLAAARITSMRPGRGGSREGAPTAPPEPGSGSPVDDGRAGELGLRESLGRDLR